jgi:hypothetical protein
VLKLANPKHSERATEEPSGYCIPEIGKTRAREEVRAAGSTPKAKEIFEFMPGEITPDIA